MIKFEWREEEGKKRKMLFKFGVLISFSNQTKCEENKLRTYFSNKHLQPFSDYFDPSNVSHAMLIWVQIVMLFWTFLAFQKHFRIFLWISLKFLLIFIFLKCFYEVLVLWTLSVAEDCLLRCLLIQFLQVVKG